MHSDKAPTQEEWAAFLNALNDHKRRHDGDLSSTCMIFFSDGGMADTSMRVELFRTVAAPIPVVVVAEDAFAKSAATAMRWANAKVKQVGGADALQALHHLEVSPLEARTVLVPALKSLRGQANGSCEIISRFIGATVEEAEQARH